MLLLKRMQGGDMEGTEAERLATQALSKKEEALQSAATATEQQQAQQRMADQLQTKVEELKRQIGKYENEVITLRARARTASSMRKINEQLAGADASGTVAMLEKMKNKVQEEESLAEAYGQLSDVGGTIDEDIDKALALPSTTAASDSLAELKKKNGNTGLRRRFCHTPCVGCASPKRKDPRPGLELSNLQIHASST